jgi:hypothetical protein
MSFVKPIVVGFGLVVVAALGAQAQTVSTVTVPGPSVAALPPSPPMFGPRPSSTGNFPSEPSTVIQSGNDPGPAPGATDGPVPPHFEKPAGWDASAAMHPYQDRQSPKPN